MTVPQNDTPDLNACAKRISGLNQSTLSAFKVWLRHPDNIFTIPSGFQAQTDKYSVGKVFKLFSNLRSFVELGKTFQTPGALTLLDEGYKLIDHWRNVLQL